MQAFHPDHYSASMRIQELYRVWDQLREGRLMPKRHEFNPMSVPHLLPFIFLDNVQNNPMGFKLRLVGTALVECLGFDPTGQLRESNEDTKSTWKRLEAVTKEKEPIIGENLIYDNSETYQPEYDSIHLPFSSDGENVDIILSLSSIQKQESLHTYLDNRSNQTVSYS